MDRLTSYRHLIKNLISEHAELINRQPTPGLETECIFDEERDQYMLFTVGWSQRRRVRSTSIYVRLRNGKIWIEDDMTEDGVACRLVEAGVPREDIVLGFQPPEMRPLTEFAVA